MSLVCSRQSQRASHQEISQNWSGGEQHLDSWPHLYHLYFVIKVGTDKLLEFKGEDKQWPDSAWVAAPVPSGSLVLIHGQLYHKSEQNTSLQPRHAYTFHVIETEGSHYASKNWLQPTKEPLPRLYFSSRNKKI